MRTLLTYVCSLVLVWLSVLPSTPAVAAALTDTTNLVVPTDFTVSLPCAHEGAGDLVQFSGDLHVLFHVTISNSSRVTVKFQFQPEGISGTGEPTTPDGTGDTYHAVGVTEGTISFDGVTGFPFETTLVNNFNIIGNGPGNNALVHENFHVTIDANAEVTAFLDNLQLTCTPASP